MVAGTLISREEKGNFVLVWMSRSDDVSDVVVVENHKDVLKGGTGKFLLDNRTTLNSSLEVKWAQSRWDSYPDVWERCTREERSGQ